HRGRRPHRGRLRRTKGRSGDQHARKRSWCQRNHHARRESMNRKLWLLAALATVALISAGCGSSGPSGTGTASSTGTTNGTGSTGTGKNATGQDEAVKFAECVRAHGVPHFP